MYFRKKYKMTVVKVTMTTPKMSIKNERYTYYNTKTPATLP